MNRFGWLYGLVMAPTLVSLAGCTALAVNKYKGDGDDSSRSGYAYMLDFTQYEITVTRTLVGCTAGQLPKINTEVAAISNLVPDGANVYVIDPQSLTGAFKISDMNVDFKDGRLIAFNSEVEDKTGEVIQSVATTAGKIALLSAGIPTPVNGVAPIGCSANAAQSIRNRDANKQLLTAATQVLDNSKEALTDLTTRYTAKPLKTLAKQLKAQKSVVDTAQKNVDNLQKQIMAVNTALTRTTTITWPNESTTFDSGALLPIDPSTMSEWIDEASLRSIQNEGLKISIDDAGVETLDNGGASGNAARLQISESEFAAKFPLLTVPNFDIRGCPLTSTTEACTQLEALRTALPRTAPAPDFSKLKNMVSFHLAVRGSYGSKASAKATNDPKAGLRYRVPASGWLYVCEGDGACDKPEQKGRVIHRQADKIAQLGAVFNLPFSSPSFASSSMSVSFDEKGQLLKGQTKRTNAAALTAADAAGSIVNQAQAYEKAKNAAPLTKLNSEVAIAKAKKELSDANEALVKSPQDSLASELALLETQKKVNDARAALGGGRVADLQSQLDIVKLEVALAEQQKKLAEDPSASDTAVAAQYSAQTAVLNAQKAKLEAEAALIAAQRALNEAGRPE